MVAGLEKEALGAEAAGQAMVTGENAAKGGAAVATH